MGMGLNDLIRERQFMISPSLTTPHTSDLKSKINQINLHFILGTGDVTSGGQFKTTVKLKSIDPIPDINPNRRLFVRVKQMDRTHRTTVDCISNSDPKYTPWFFQSATPFDRTWLWTVSACLSVVFWGGGGGMVVVCGSVHRGPVTSANRPRTAFSILISVTYLLLDADRIYGVVLALLEWSNGLIKLDLCSNSCEKYSNTLVNVLITFLLWFHLPKHRWRHNISI